MSKETKINASDDAWESGQLGRNAEFVRVSKNANESNVDDAIGLKLISIRLQKSLIEDFKNLARFNGIGYQTLMRQVLKKFTENEKGRMAEIISRQQAQHNNPEYNTKGRIAL